MPPVGCECEAVWLDLPDGGDRDFTKVLIKSYYDYGGGFKRVWFGVMPEDEDVCRSAAQCEFRPLRTQAERDRDSTIDLSIAILGSINAKVVDHWEVLGKLYDAGMLRKPAKEVGRDELMEMIGESYSYALSDDIADAILSTYNVTKKE